MFTGIIEEKGTVRGARQAGRSMHLDIACQQVLHGVNQGDSIAVNGVCLTVVEHGPDHFTADVMPETWAKTTLGDLKPGDPVNLERSMQAGGRFGGHIVQGHVDGVGTIRRIEPAEIARLVTIAAPPEVLRYVVPKGSVAVDGISLTVIETGDGWFSLGIIPHTWQVTTMGHRRPGDRVNLEADILGKYVEKFVTARFGPPAAGGVTADLLRKAGFTA